MSRTLEQAAARSAASDRMTSGPGADTADRLRSLGYVSGRASSWDLQAQPGVDPKTKIARYEAYVRTFNLGMTELDEGRLAEAEVNFRRLTRDFPLAFEAHQYLGRCARGARRALRPAVA